MIDAMHVLEDVRLLHVANNGRVEILYECGDSLAATVAGSAHDRLTWALQSYRLHVLAGHAVQNGSSSDPGRRVLPGVQVAFGPTMRPDSDHRLVNFAIDADRPRPPEQLVTASCRCDFLQQHAGTRGSYDAIECALLGIDAHVRAAELAHAAAIARLDALPAMTYVLTDGERTLEYRQKGTVEDSDLAGFWHWFPGGVTVSKIDELGTVLRTGHLDWDESLDGGMVTLGVRWDSVLAASSG